MDRISALRNVEEALSSYEAGELSLPELERDVRAVLRAYATDFEDKSAYRAAGAPRVEGLVVVAASPAEARTKIEALVDDPGSFDLERVQ